MCNYAHFPTVGKIQVFFFYFCVPVMMNVYLTVWSVRSMVSILVYVLPSEKRRF